MLKNLFIALLLVAFSVSLYAADIDDLDVGDDVYIEGIFSDDLVYVVRIDKEENRVKVRNHQTNRTIWVSPSKLISRKESSSHDIVLGGVALGVAYCLLSDNCGETRSTASTDYKFNFKVKNRCHKKIKLALHYSHADGKGPIEGRGFSSVGYWNFDPNSNGYLRFEGNQYASTNNRSFYYYAESTDGTMSWKGKHNKSLSDGTILPMSIITDNGTGDLILDLTCK